MPYKSVGGFKDQKGEEYWGTDRLERMVRTKDLESEIGALVLLDQVAHKVKSLIDLGCGIGRRHIHFDVERYVGIDREQIMIDKGKELFPHLELYQSELMNLSTMFPWFKDIFDMAFTFHVVQYNHEKQQKEIFNNIYEVIKPGGYYYMKENVTDCPRKRVPSDKFEIVDTEDPNGHTLFRKIK